MELYDFRDSIAEQTQTYVSTRMKKFTAEQCGLDRRAGSFYVCETGVAVKLNSVGSAEYYGGLQYCDKDDTFVVGDYKFYASACPRIESILDHLGELLLIDDQAEG